ncbi:hypothetical protein V6N11_009464 [Hibiscus sabdariffa]|uniref:Uncharacterized protein n=1 Tax=Hibiscus sabdariffa TaxID=183260 RepID=A0ABR2P5F3_9ROSI
MSVVLGSETSEKTLFTSDSPRVVICVHCVLQLFPYGFVDHPLPIHSRLSFECSRHDIDAAITEINTQYRHSANYEEKST